MITESTPKPYVSGHYTPVVDEITAHELSVHGTIPPSSAAATSATATIPSPATPRPTGSRAAA